MGNFTDTGKALLCQSCLDKPKHSYIDIYSDCKYKIYFNKDGRVLSFCEPANHVLIQIRQEIDHKIFDPEDYQTEIIESCNLKIM